MGASKIETSIIVDDLRCGALRFFFADWNEPFEEDCGDCWALVDDGEKAAVLEAEARTTATAAKATHRRPRNVAVGPDSLQIDGWLQLS